MAPNKKIAFTQTTFQADKLSNGITITITRINNAGKPLLYEVRRQRKAPRGTILYYYYEERPRN